MSGIYKGVGNQLIFTDSLRLIRSNNVKILALLLYFKRKNTVRVYLLFDSWIIQATCKLTIMIKKNEVLEVPWVWSQDFLHILGY